MQVAKPRTRRGGFLLGLLSVFAVSVSAGNSILDIVNMEKVEKLLAERRENATRFDQDGRFLVQNSIDSDDGYFAGDDTEDEVPGGDETSNGGRNRQKFPSNNILRYDDRGRGHRNLRNNLTGVPDFATVLADLTGSKPDKILKSEGDPMLVTKKKYLKKDWCRTEPMTQKIREEGCLTKTILNRFCYGQCNSFYVPRNPPRRRRNRKRPFVEEDTEQNPAFRSCVFCKPKKASWMTVTLRCPAIPPHLRKKRVQRIKQCKCIAEDSNPY